MTKCFDSRKMKKRQFVKNIHIMKRIFINKMPTY